MQTTALLRSDRILRRVLEKLSASKIIVILIIFDALGMFRKSFEKRVERVENRRTSRDHPNHCIVEIGQNTAKSPGDLR